MTDNHYLCEKNIYAMELLYLYIKDDKRNIKNCEFNFSPKYRFHYDDENKLLSLRIGEQDPINWFGSNIENVSAVIGKNGAGKSNLIDCIINALSGQGGGLVIWSYRGKLYRNKYSLDIKADFQIRELTFWGSPFNNIIKSNEIINDSAVIYFSPNIDKKVGAKSTLYKFKDISTANYLRRKNDYKNKKYNSYYFSDVDYMQIIDTFRLILFFIYYQEESLPKDIRIPEYLEVTFRSYDVKHEKHPAYIQLMKDTDNSFEGQLKSIFIKQFFSNDEFSESWDEKTTFEELLNHFLLNTDERPNIYNELVELYNNKHIFCDFSARKGSSKWDYFTFSIKRTALSTKLMTALFCYYFSQEPANASFTTLEHSKIANNGISVNWDGLSSGELSFYTFLARINSELTNFEGELYYHAKNEAKIAYRNDYKNFIILLDEPELSFHPEWQQKFVNLLLGFLEKLYPNFRFQIIIASHSPILVSDFPKNNIIFLDKNEDGTCKVVNSICQEDTFGANIQTLYRNSFFLKGLPIGEFAKRKINKLFEELERGSIRPTTLQEIQLIGEPLLKNQLIKLYKQYADLSHNVNERIVQLEEEVKYLKEKLNDKN